MRKLVFFLLIREKKDEEERSTYSTFFSKSDFLEFYTQ